MNHNTNIKPTNWDHLQAKVRTSAPQAHGESVPRTLHTISLPSFCSSYPVESANMLIQIFTRPLDLMKLGRSHGNRYTLLRIVITVGGCLTQTNQPHESRREWEGEHNRQPVFFTRLTTTSNFVQKLILMWTHVVQSLTVRHSKR